MYADVYMSKNSTSNQTAWFIRNTVSIYVIIPYSVINILWIVFIVISNSVLLYVYAKHKSIRVKSVQVLLSGLAANDLMVAVAACINFYLKIVVYMEWRSSGRAFGSTASGTNCLASIVCMAFPLFIQYCLLMLISIDRAVSVKFPMKHKIIMSHTHCWIFIAVVYAFVGTVLAIVYTLTAEDAVKGYDPYLQTCNFNIFPKRYRAVMTVAMAGLPLGISVLLHLLVACYALKTFRTVAPDIVMVTSPSLSKTLKVTKGTAIVLCAFIVCVIPSVIYRAVADYYEYTSNSQIVDMLLAGLLGFHAVLNPLIYTYSYPEIRKYVRPIAKLFCKRLRYIMRGCRDF